MPALLLFLLACHPDQGDTGPSLGGTGGDDPGLDDNFGVEEAEGDPACENLLPGNCLMPFPSDRFRGEDGHLDFGEDALPLLASGRRTDGSFFRTVDGYGVASPILIQWPGATLDGAPAVFDPAASLEADSKTVLLNATTGERIAHWTETDWMTDDLDAPVLILRPAQPLPAGTRVVVAMRGLVDATGAALEPTPGFLALRDQQRSETVGIHARREHFEADVFPVLESAGIARGDLQLAWDFTTATHADAITDLVTMRDRMMDAVGADGPAYTIDRVELEPHASIAVKVWGTVSVPSFLGEPDAVGVRRIRRDADGLPVIEGVEERPFTVQIPHSVWQGDGSADVVQYGHGFLGRMAEADNSWIREFADRAGFVIVAMNLQGMDEETIDVWIPALAADAGNFPWFAEAAMQGVINQVAVQRMMAGGFAEDTDERFTFDGAPVYDPARIRYTGNSQGGTLGTLTVALSQDVDRAVLGVPGCAFPFLLHRSVDFSPFELVLRGFFPDRADASMLLALLGTGFHRFDGFAFGPHLGDDPLPGTPAHEVLLHIAKEDAQVHNENSFMLGRAAGAVIVPDAVRVPWGFAEGTYPITAPVSMIEYDFGVPDDPTPLDPPPAETDTHGWLRKLPEAQDQLIHFLRTGEVIDTCAGAPCVFDGEP